MEDVERGSTDGEVSDYLASSDDEDGMAGRRAGLAGLLLTDPLLPSSGLWI